MSSTAWYCPQGKTWRDFSAISFSPGTPGSITLARFSDGLYARLEDGKSVQEMYQLPNDIYLFKGYDPFKQAGPSPFVMLEMPAGIVTNFLAGYFQQPCAVPSAPTAFSYANTGMSRAGITVTGNAHWVNPSSVVFDFMAVEQRQPGVNIKASGTINFLDLAPIPPSTVISGWTIARGAGARAEVVEGLPTVSTFKDLEPLLKTDPKQP